MLLLTQPRTGLSLGSKLEDIIAELYVVHDRAYSIPLVKEALEELSIETENEMRENSELPANYGDFYN